MCLAPGVDANDVLDRLPRLTSQWGLRTIDSFRLWGWCGLAAAGFVTMAMSLWLGVSPTTTLALAVAGVSSFYLWAFARRLITGHERLILLEHVWLAFGAAALVVWIGALPRQSSLDVFSVGLGTFLAFGRIGCLQVGCCHGTPGRIGVRYGEGFGLSSRLATHRLVPVQLYESVGIAVVTVVAMLLATHGPGTATVWFLSSYAGLRFVTESLRGDPRPRLLGVSVPRAMCLAQLGVALALADRWLVEGSLDRGAYIGLAAAAAIAIAAIAIAGRRPNPLTSPAHLDDVWTSIITLGSLASENGPLLDTTELGMHIAVGPAGEGLHVSLSHPSLDARDVGALLLSDETIVQRGIVHLRFDRDVAAAPEWSSRTDPNTRYFSAPPTVVARHCEKPLVNDDSPM